MGFLNLCATAVLVMLHAINASYNWPNPFVTVAAPLAAAVFLVLTAVWLLESVRRYRARGSTLAAGGLQAIRLRQPCRVLMSPVLEPQSWRRFARGALGR
jgi:hypothetical protein